MTPEKTGILAEQPAHRREDETVLTPATGLRPGPVRADRWPRIGEDVEGYAIEAILDRTPGRVRYLARHIDSGTSTWLHCFEVDGAEQALDGLKELRRWTQAGERVLSTFHVFHRIQPHGEWIGAATEVPRAPSLGSLVRHHGPLDELAAVQVLHRLAIDLAALAGEGLHQPGITAWQVLALDRIVPPFVGPILRDGEQAPTSPWNAGAAPAENAEARSVESLGWLLWTLLRGESPPRPPGAPRERQRQLRRMLRRPPRPRRGTAARSCSR